MSLKSTLLTVLLLLAHPAFAQYPERDLHRVPAVVFRVEEIIEPGNATTGTPVKVKGVILERLYSADSLPQQLVLKKDSYEDTDMDVGGKPVRVTHPPPKVGERAIVYLNPGNKGSGTVMFWRPDTPDQRRFTMMEIESLRSEVPLSAIQAREYEKVLNKLDYARMCQQATDVIIGGTSSAGRIRVDARLKDSGSNQAQSLKSRPVFVANTTPVDDAPKTIIFLQANKSFDTLPEKYLHPKFSFDAERQTYESLLFSYRPIENSFYAVLWSPAREQRVAALIKQSKDSPPKRTNVNAEELEQIVTQTYDRCYRIKKEAVIRDGRYVNASLAIRRYTNLNEMIRRNLGPHPLSLLPLSELWIIYNELGKKEEAAAIQKQRTDLAGVIKRHDIDGGWALYEGAPPAQPLKP